MGCVCVCVCLCMSEMNEVRSLAKLGEPNCNTDTGKWADFANIQLLPVEEKEGERGRGERGKGHKRNSRNNTNGQEK